MAPQGQQPLRTIALGMILLRKRPRRSLLAGSTYEDGVRHMTHIYKVPLILTRQPEGGYIVTSLALSELVTEGDTIDEALLHVQDAVQAVVELYEDLCKPFPATLQQSPETDAI